MDCRFSLLIWAFLTIIWTWSFTNSILPLPCHNTTDWLKCIKKEIPQINFYQGIPVETCRFQVRLQAQNGQKQRPFFWNSLVYYFFWEMKAIPCKKLTRNWRSHTTLCTTPFTEQRKLSLTRIEWGVGGPGAQLSQRTSALVCLVWETDASQVLIWQLH